MRYIISYYRYLFWCSYNISIAYIIILMFSLCTDVPMRVLVHMPSNFVSNYTTSKTSSDAIVCPCSRSGLFCLLGVYIACRQALRAYILLEFLLIRDARNAFCAQTRCVYISNITTVLCNTDMTEVQFSAKLK